MCVILVASVGAVWIEDSTVHNSRKPRQTKRFKHFEGIFIFMMLWDFEIPISIEQVIFICIGAENSKLFCLNM